MFLVCASHRSCGTRANQFPQKCRAGGNLSETAKNPTIPRRGDSCGAVIAAGRLARIDRAIGTVAVVVAGLFVVIVASGFGAYEWVVSAAWAACGLALWMTRRAPPSAKPVVSLKE
jgi:hypothetical protein